jgi:hypothetical protein
MPDQSITTRPACSAVWIDRDEAGQYEWEVYFGDSRYNRIGACPSVEGALDAVQKVLANG